MQIEVSDRTAELIHRLVASGRYRTVESALEAITEELAGQLDRDALGDEPQRSWVSRLPDPPLPDQSVSPPCDLHRPSGLRVHPRTGQGRLPDPLVLEQPCTRRCHSTPRFNRGTSSEPAPT
jgi:hypothetical protein